MTLQDYLDCEIKRGVEKGIAEAVDATVAETVEKTVAMLKDLNISKEQILEQLMQKYDFTEEKAKSFLN